MIQTCRHPVTLGGGITVPGMGLGCMALTEFYGADSRHAEPDRVIGRAIDLGIGLLDTADAYGPWRNEEAVGRALRARRDQVVLATKFGVVRRQNESDGITGGLCGRPDYVKQSCEASLRRLQTDYIDLYYMHRLDPTTPIEDTTGALKDLVTAGKIRGFGFCEIGPNALRRAAAIHPVAAVQSEFSLWHRDPQHHAAAFAQTGTGFVAYSPMGRGFLSGKIRSPEDFAPDDWRRLSPKFQGENFNRNLRVLDRLTSFAADRRCTPAQLALAWIKSTWPSCVPLSGATDPAQLDENVAALEMKLTAQELAEIDALAPADAFAGASWPTGSVGAQTEPA